MKEFAKHIILLLLIMLATAQKSFSQCTKKYDSTLHRVIYTKVDVMPAFPSGQDGFMQYTIKNLQAPENTFEDCPQAGSINYSFIVETNGLITNIVIDNIRDISAMCVFQKEFYYLLKSSPKWSTGKCGNKLVPVKINSHACILLQ